MSLSENEKRDIINAANAVKPPKIIDPQGRAVVERQRVCLLEAVREAREAEEKRCDFLDNKLPRSVRAKYEERFNAERARDQEKIDRLVTDFKMIKKAVVNGEFAAARKERSMISNTVEGKYPEARHNRFEGLETPVDIIFHKTIINMFDNYDKKFEARHAPKFNEYAEKKRLKLLEDKRTLLNKLVSVQRNEIVEHMRAKQQTGLGLGADNGVRGVMSAGGGIPRHGSQSARDTQSVCSSRSSASSSGESWATFASRSSNRGGVGNYNNNSSRSVGRLGLPLIHKSRPKPFVPSLPLHALHNK